MQCGAKTKTGAPCKTPAMPAGRCRFHGGKSRAGIASATFKTGRYSKHLPTRLAATYQEVQRDPDLLALTEEVHLIDARLIDVLGRVETGESGQLWREVRATYQKLSDANNAKDMDAARQALGTLGDLITHGHADWAAWVDVRTLIEQRRKLVESERRRRIDMQQMITAERAMVLLAAVVDTVRRHVHDDAALAGISADLEKLVAHASVPGHRARRAS